MKHSFTGSNAPKRQSWARDDIEGTPEELATSFEVAEKYLYKILSYADSEDETIPDDVLLEERRIFSFAKQGPRASHFRLAKKDKLVSADVLYMLTSSLPGSKISEKFDISIETVKRIRRGDVPDWYWEYIFVRRLKTILRHQLTQSNCRHTEVLYSISKLNEDMTISILHYTTSKRKAKELRESILTKREFTKITNNKTIDILYPIDLIHVLK